MKVLWFLALFALSVSAARIKEDERVDGVNGWFVPQADGSLEWIDIEEAKAAEEAEKRAPLITPVTFYLYTKANPNLPTRIFNNSESITKSNFNPKNPTRFVIHGFGDSLLGSMNRKIRQAWLEREDTNVIFVDYASGRTVSYYLTSTIAVPRVGKKIAQLVNFLVSNHGVSLDNVHLVGASLGAQVAGFTGKNVIGQVRTIVALDAAGPLFKDNIPEKRLAKTDAFYVESIHANGGGLGVLEPIGDGAFYLNGGESQPGCFTKLCSHLRAVEYYVKAVEKNNIRTIKCENYLDAIDNKCGATYSPVLLGAVSGNFVSGVFYVPT